MVISVNNLNKTFKQYKKGSGLSGSVKALFKREYFDIEAVKDLSFEIERGELVGFIGSNGAGKTTALKCLSGLLHPTGGTVNVLGYTPWDRKRDFLKNISLIMGQKNQLWWDLPAIDSFLLNKVIYEISDEDFDNRVGELVELLDLSEILNIQVRKLSLGQRMKCEIAASLLHEPEVIFLDEPTIGLDVVMQQRLRQFFKEYNEMKKTTIMLTSHYMDDVKELCKRVLVIDKGVLIYDGQLDELVARYAIKKNIVVTTSKVVLDDDVKQFGEIVEHDDRRWIIAVDRMEVPKVASELLKRLPVEDLDIREITLDEVVRRIFSK